jgi:hypothetical protein
MRESGDDGLLQRWMTGTSCLVHWYRNRGIRLSSLRDTSRAYHGEEGQYKDAVWHHWTGLMRLDHSEKGSIMRHTRPGDAATHDHSSVAPRFVEAGVTLANVHSKA